MTQLDLSFVRPQFPALALVDGGRPAVYFDGPGGTQVPRRVIDAMTHYLIHTNSNHGGAFRTTRESDAVLQAAHEAMADLLNAASPQEIVFGANMTTLTFSVSRAIGRELGAGDEILITRLDHDANRAPWLALREKGVIVTEVDFDPADCTLRLDDLAAKSTPLRKSRRWSTLPAHGSGLTRCTTSPTARSTSRRSGATSSSAPHTSSSARTPAPFGAGWSFSNA